MAKMYIRHVARDSSGHVPGSGWVIMEGSRRIDWPMLTTREEAEADLREFVRDLRGLRNAERSEQIGLYYMGAL